MTLKFVHTADVHIKKDGDESFTALAEILEKARASKACALFITGDLFEADKYAFDVRHKLRELFESYSEIKILMIPGNHDENSYEKSIHYGSNATILSEKPFEKNTEIDGLSIYGIPFQRGMNLSPIIKKIDDNSKKDKNFPVFLTHGTLIDERLKHILVLMSEYESENDSFYIHGDDFNKTDLPLVLLGHYHDHTMKKYGKTTITYSGSPIPTNIKNSGKRRASLITIDTKKNTVKIDGLFLSSSYNTNKILKSVPGREDTVFKELELFLKESGDPIAYADVKVEGYISIEEKTFQDKLNNINDKHKSKFKKIHIKNTTRQISSIKQYPLVEQFLSKWENEFEKDSSDEKKTEIYLRALELALDAFEETLIKKKASK